MKKSYIAISLASSVLLFSCLKDKPNVDFDNLAYITEISTASTNGTDQAPSGGLAYFSGAVIGTSVSSDPDDNFFTVNVASPYPPTKDIPVTLAINDAARVTYNATTPDYTYGQMPADAYSFPATTGTVHAGRRLDTFNLTFHHDKMDPTKDYMLPISVTQAPGTTISGNMSTIYFHIIGNLLAVNLNHDYSQWDAPADTAGVPTTTMPTVTTFMTPLSPLKVEAASSFNSGTTAKLRYDLAFVRSGNSLNTFTVTFKSGDTTAMRKVGDTVLVGPSLLKADFAAGVYRLGYQLGTATGRKYIVDKFYK